MQVLSSVGDQALLSKSPSRVVGQVISVGGCSSANPKIWRLGADPGLLARWDACAAADMPAALSASIKISLAFIGRRFPLSIPTA